MVGDSVEFRNIADFVGWGWLGSRALLVELRGDVYL